MIDNIGMKFVKAILPLIRTPMLILAFYFIPEAILRGSLFYRALPTLINKYSRSALIATAFELSLEYIFFFILYSKLRTRNQ